MRMVLKHIVGRTYKPLLQKYLSKTRVYRHGDIRLEIPPQVFHPGFFFSTGLLLQYVSRFELNGKKMLELGAGSGLISIHATRKGAELTATDINPIAVEYLEKNCRQNQVKVNIILSDLFTAIPVQPFDIIAINPPYYKKHPLSIPDHAWFCGENGEYFYRLFSQLNDYIKTGSLVAMVLCDGCDIDMVRNAAAENQFVLHCVETKHNLLEKNFIYQILPAR